MQCAGNATVPSLQVDVAVCIKSALVMTIVLRHCRGSIRRGVGRWQRAWSWHSSGFRRLILLWYLGAWQTAWRRGEPLLSLSAQLDGQTKLVHICDHTMQLAETRDCVSIHGCLTKLAV